jgi:hypothetical protein
VGRCRFVSSGIEETGIVLDSQIKVKLKEEQCWRPLKIIQILLSGLAHDAGRVIGRGRDTAGPVTSAQCPNI